jgi:hypothetical protein
MYSLLDDGLMTSTFGDYLCDGMDVIIFFSGACCVMFHLLFLILIVLVKFFAATFSLQRERLKSLSLVPQRTGLSQS